MIPYCVLPTTQLSFFLKSTPSKRKFVADVIITPQMSTLTSAFIHNRSSWHNFWNLVLELHNILKYIQLQFHLCMHGFTGKTFPKNASNQASILNKYKIQGCFPPAVGMDMNPKLYIGKTPLESEVHYAGTRCENKLDPCEITHEQLRERERLSIKLGILRLKKHG